MRLRLINEGYGRTYEFDYHGNQVTDPRPNVLSLGQWTSTRGNRLVAGINLNYLTSDQITRLQKGLQLVLKDRNLKRRVATFRALFGDIFNTAYRTYYKDGINMVDPGTLKFITKPEPKDVDPTRDPTPERPDDKPRFMDAPRRLSGDLADRIKQRHAPEVDDEDEKEVPDEIKQEVEDEEDDEDLSMFDFDEADFLGGDNTEPEPEDAEEDERQT